MFNQRFPRLFLLLGGFLLPVLAYGQEPPKPAAGEGEELTRGPIHEAFGQPMAFDPQPGPIVPKEPPAAIEELPPDQKPEGENVAWMAGYWAYDDEDKNFIWISGFWRTLPPDRKWVSGYWTAVEGGHQWVSGFWASEKTTELEYLPQPPESLENGPSTEPAAGQIWMPGCWIWQSNRYAWRAGYWATTDPDWLWVPCHYEWSPNGYVFVNGYYDYPLYRRGLLFAPVRFARIAPGFTYQPSVVIDTRFLAFSLFSRPRYQHYYFGDYYAANYVQGGIYPWFSFHYSRHGYDPLYAHTSLVRGRSDPRWDANLRASYVERRTTVGARPPHTYAAYSEWARTNAGAGRQTLAIAQPLTQISTQRDYPVRVQKITQNQIQQINVQNKQVQKFREERVKVEKEGARNLPQSRTDPKVRARSEPSKLRLPDVPNLVSPGPGKKSESRPRPAEPKFPEVNPKQDPPTAKGKGRNLPDPEEIIRRQPPMKTPKIVPKNDDPMPPPKKVDPVPPPKKVDPTPPPKKVNPGPPKKVDPTPPPKKVNPGPPPKKVEPVPLPKNDPPPKKGPPPKKKDKDGD